MTVPPHLRLRKPLPPEVVATLQAGFDRLVEGFLNWQQTDSIDPGLPLHFTLGLDIDMQLPEGRGFGHTVHGDFESRAPLPPGGDSAVVAALHAMGTGPHEPPQQVYSEVKGYTPFGVAVPQQLTAEEAQAVRPGFMRPSPDARPDLYECVECSSKPGAPSLCDRCLEARRAAGPLWIGPRP